MYPISLSLDTSPLLWFDRSTIFPTLPMVDLFIVPEEWFTISYDATKLQQCTSLLGKELTHMKYNLWKIS